MCSVSAAWVGATHLLKSTFRTVHHVAAVLVVQHTDDSNASDGNHSTVTPTVAATSAITTPIYFDLYHHSFDDVSPVPLYEISFVKIENREGETQSTGRKQKKQRKQLNIV